MPGRRRRRVLSLLLVAPILGLGTAFLAANVVDASYAGQTLVTVAVPTSISATDSAKINMSQQDQHDYYHFINVSATLSGGGVPLVGEVIHFTAEGGVICDAVTDANGEADCPSDTKVPTSDFTGSVPTTFTATFAGEGSLVGSSATGALTQVG